MKNLISKIKKLVVSDCFNFKKIDCCRIVCSKCLLKLKVDKCADTSFGFKGGCDCILILKDKVIIVECKCNKFGSGDAKRATKQVTKCYELLREKLDYNGVIRAVILHENVDSTAAQRVRLELKALGLSPKFSKCGHDIAKLFK